MYSLTYLDPIPLNTNAKHVLVSVANPSFANIFALYNALLSLAQSESLPPSIRPRNVRMWWQGTKLMDCPEDDQEFMAECQAADQAACGKAAKLMKAWRTECAALYA